jgi:hypothetical protein
MESTSAVAGEEAIFCVNLRDLVVPVTVKGDTTDSLPLQDVYWRRSPECLRSLALLAAGEQVEERQWVSKEPKS